MSKGVGDREIRHTLCQEDRQSKKLCSFVRLQLGSAREPHLFYEGQCCVTAVSLLLPRRTKVEGLVFPGGKETGESNIRFEVRYRN